MPCRCVPWYPAYYHVHAISMGYPDSDNDLTYINAMPISGIFWQGGLLRIVMSAANLISILIIPKHYLIYFPPPQKKVLKCAIYRQAKVSKLSLVFWLNEIVCINTVVSSPWHSPSKLGLCSSDLSKTCPWCRYSLSATVSYSRLKPMHKC